jgi:hypothetical protein
MGKEPKKFSTMLVCYPRDIFLLAASSSCFCWSVDAPSSYSAHSLSFFHDWNPDISFLNCSLLSTDFFLSSLFLNFLHWKSYWVQDITCVCVSFWDYLFCFAVRDDVYATLDKLCRWSKFFLWCRLEGWGPQAWPQRHSEHPGGPRGVRAGCASPEVTSTMPGHGEQPQWSRRPLGAGLSTRERLALGGGRGAEAAAVCGHAGLVLACLVECGRSASPASVDGTRITTSSTSLSALWWRCLIAALVLGPCILHHTDPAFQVHHFSLCWIKLIFCYWNIILC